VHWRQESKARCSLRRKGESRDGMVMADGRDWIQGTGAYSASMRFEGGGG